MVYIVVTILNGYKNIHGVYRHKEDAERKAQELRSSHTYELHEVYVCDYIVW